MNILLACAGGVSTGMIADKMMTEAQKRGLQCKVWAVDDGEIGNELDNNKVDIVLIGPQIKFKLKKIQEKYKDRNVKILCMNPVDYGMNDAAKILDFGIKNIGE